MDDQPIYVGQWIQGDKLSDLIFYALRPDAPAQPFDLTGTSAHKLLLRSRDPNGYKADIAGAIVTDGSVQMEDGTPVTSATQGVLKFSDITNGWPGPPSGIKEAFDAYVRFARSGNTGYLNPYVSLDFRKAP